jgi:hypothetical protein
MAYSHYEVDEANKPARDFMDALRSLRAAWDSFRNVRGALLQQEDQSSGNADGRDFATIAVTYGYDTNGGLTAQQNAKASFAEIDSAFNAGDAAVTQMLNRHLTK